MHRIACITVTHNSAHVVDGLLAALHDLASDSTFGFSAVIVDNRSADDTRERVRAGPLFQLVPLPDNRGFAAGVNAGLARTPDDADLVLLLNPDVALSREALARLVAALDARPDAAAVVPSLRGSDGSMRAGALPDFTRGDALFGWCGSRWLRVRSLALRLASPRAHELADAYCEGGCLLIRRAALADGLDERFFLYFEDVDLSRRLRAEGHALLHAGDAIADERATKGSCVEPNANAEDERLRRYLCFLASEARYHAKWHGAATARLVAFVRGWITLPVRSFAWRARYGIERLRRSGRSAIRDALR